MKKLYINDEVLFIDKIKDFDSNESYQDNSIIDKINFEHCSKALTPIVDIWKEIKNEFKSIEANEVELSLQMQIGLSGNDLVFALVNAEAQAHIAVKLLWKKD